MARRSICAIALVAVTVACMPRAQAGQNPGTAVITGSVSYRERMALPPDAVVDVWVTDVSPGITAAAVLAEGSFPVKGRQVPVPFELPYDPGRVAADHDYGLRAVIRTPSQTLFESGDAVRVITKGSPTRVDLVLRRQSSAADGPRPAPSPLLGSSWQLEDLAGAGVIDNSRATLEFPEAGRVAGNGSCNRFFGTATIEGQSLTLGALGSTMMACPEAVGNQERQYLEALQAAERFEIKEPVLLVYTKGREQPLRFVRTKP